MEPLEYLYQALHRCEQYLSLLVHQDVILPLLFFRVAQEVQRLHRLASPP